MGPRATTARCSAPTRASWSRPLAVRQCARRRRSIALSLRSRPSRGEAEGAPATTAHCSIFSAPCRCTRDVIELATAAILVVRVPVRAVAMRTPQAAHATTAAGGAGRRRGGRGRRMLSFATTPFAPSLLGLPSRFEAALVEVEHVASQLLPDVVGRAVPVVHRKAQRSDVRRIEPVVFEAQHLVRLQVPHRRGHVVRGHAHQRAPERDHHLAHDALDQRDRLVLRPAGEVEEDAQGHAARGRRPATCGLADVRDMRHILQGACRARRKPPCDDGGEGGGERITINKIKTCD